MRGFTLFDLLVTVALAAIVAGLALPMLHASVLNAQRRDALNAWMSSVYLARHTAIRRLLPVVICPATPSPCETPADWNSGWIVFINADGDVPPQLDAGETILRQEPPRPRITLHSNRAAFRFHRVGLRSTNGTVTVCDSRGSEGARTIIISYTGRPRIATTMANGDTINC
ncbi:MAG: GspH/FimT family pseudopilin [Gammaproteobacteria bacterium]|nr:GspH/FimT family pseudopilin [Gammaproteobacteria bacterium]